MIPISLLELAFISEDSNARSTFEKTKELAQLVDNLGYKRLWLAEHHNMVHVASTATSVLIGHLAGHTQNIRVGSGGIMLPNHSPLIVAEQFGTLAQLYPDRIDLGLGRAPGSDIQTALAIQKDFYEQSQRFPQNVEALEMYFSHKNPYAKVRAFIAEDTHVPIWILGSSTESAALAASKGLPYAFAGHFAPRQMLEAFALYRQNFKASDVLKQPYTIAAVNATAAETDQQAEKLSTSLYQMFQSLAQNSAKFLQPPVDSLAGLLDGMSEQVRLQVEQMTACSFVGSKEKIRHDLKAFLGQTGVDELMIHSPVYDHKEKLKSMMIMKEVMDDLNR
ncbi:MULTISPECIES: LLM class flavin-dependent oxidoreductase [Sphingobacterium]|uniref:Luciferase-like monooxygenase n=1 Tax=Sphingobacterium athyrii TaxID=2152717 RepID=A0A363NWV5_9SPHI|nr:MULTISPECIES: LLM class flavin-dependent oxidoreductase [Sphingobacterium]PUV25275.1 LLM class flavin-dependent oxidoreductase [Sphingobacterium athyrii]QIH34598.1 LLM class flavin-dependent oxidoreductase [Sphingobacterium sp. DR205]